MEHQEIGIFHSSAAAEVQEVCSEYGLYGNVIYYNPSPIEGSNRNRLYLVAGTVPELGKDISALKPSPEEILRKIERNEDLFYPRMFAIDLSTNPDQMHAIQDLVNYCKKAEFITQLYAEHGLEPPEKLRASEVNQLITFRDTLDNPRANAAMKKKCREDLEWFFKREKSTGFRRRWLDYFRSSKFPKDKGAAAKLRGYFNRDENEVTMDQLTEGTDQLRKIEMQEYEFKHFQKFIKDCYPDVLYFAKDKEIVDHGLIGKHKDENGPFGRAVTAEEYAVIRKERFASEGWPAVANLTPAYWEFRDVYYKAADEPLVAAAYNSIALQYAKCDPLSELKSRGPMCLQKVPASDFMNFVSLAKANNLRFYIDNLGDYATPSLDTINVLYNEYQQQKMDQIVMRMLDDKVGHSHVLDKHDNPTLTSTINKYNEINKNSSRSRAPKRNTHSID